MPGTFRDRGGEKGGSIVIGRNAAKYEKRVRDRRYSEAIDFLNFGRFIQLLVQETDETNKGEVPVRKACLLSRVEQDNVDARSYDSYFAVGIGGTVHILPYTFVEFPKDNESQPVSQRHPPIRITDVLPKFVNLPKLPAGVRQDDLRRLSVRDQEQLWVFF